MSLKEVEISAAAVKDCNTKDPLIIMSADAVIDELKKLQLKFPTKKNINISKIDDNKISNILSAFLDNINYLNENDTLLEPYLTESNYLILNTLIAQAIQSLQYSKSLVDHQGSATGILLPISFHRRLEVLLGFRYLSVAWVRHIDICKF